MTIFGKPLSEYFAFSKPFLGLILIVALGRLALFFAGVPNSAARWLSVTIAIWLGVLYFGIKVHTSGFGSYKQLLPICYLMSVTAQLVIVPSIILAILTGHDNIYSIPENFFGNDGKTWLHAAAHIFIGGLSLGPLMSWLFGSIIMFVTKKVTAKESEAKTVQA
ncbi:MAG TPA: hypothetical protein VKN18_11815 [Blastocatellia bacterium]|nr:hypothetical protein [Blastocatellia bacterium]